MHKSEQYTELSRSQDQDPGIENRIRNLFWTVCGDYGAVMHPDLALYRENPDAAVYETVRYGAFCRYFHADETALYLYKKMQKGGDEELMMMLFHLCMDTAVFDRLLRERKGIRDLRRAALPYTEQEKRDLLGRIMGTQTEEGFEQEMERFRQVRDTEEFIRRFDGIYNRFFEPDFEEKKGSLKTVLELTGTGSSGILQKAISDEQMKEIVKEYVENLKKDMLRLRRRQPVTEEKTGAVKGEIEYGGILPDPEAAEKVKEYVELNFGKSCLTPAELLNLQKKYCRGIHSGCSLHFTNGILHDPVIKNNPYLFAQLQFEKNRLHYYNHHWMVKRNITELADILQKAFVLQAQEEQTRSVSGRIVPGRLWKVGRTEDEKLFDRINPVENHAYVLDILLDSSGSQAKRQSQAAVQGYILSEALSRAGLAHRVMSFCSFWDHTILRRFRDYDDEKEKNLRILEFRATGNNRDGLAIRLAGDSLLKREQNHRILVVLSDGKPCDIAVKRPGTRELTPYQEEEAVRDTALAVRELRSRGITVLGIFSGNEEDIGSEKKIYGKDFAYIRDLRSFSRVVGSYLKKQIESDKQEELV